MLEFKINDSLSIHYNSRKIDSYLKKLTWSQCTLYANNQPYIEFEKFGNIVDLIKSEDSQYLLIMTQNWLWVIGLSSPYSNVPIYFYERINAANMKDNRLEVRTAKGLFTFKIDLSKQQYERAQLICPTEIKPYPTQSKSFLGKLFDKITGSSSSNAEEELTTKLTMS